MATWTLYDKFKEGQFDATAINLEDGTATIKIALVTSAYTPSAAHDYFNDITNEVSGTNYTAGGNACATPIVSLASSIVSFSVASPAAWAQSGTGFTDARRAILYQDTGVAATSKLIAYSAAFAADRNNVSQAFQITLAATVFTAT